MAREQQSSMLDTKILSELSDRSIRIVQSPEGQQSNKHTIKTDKQTTFKPMSPNGDFDIVTEF